MGNRRLRQVMTAVLLCIAATGFAEDAEHVNISVTADLLSKYIWRGQNVVDDWVLQPGVSVGYKDFTGSIWGNMDMRGDVVDDGAFNEIDYTLDYSNAPAGLDILIYSLGVIHYDFPNTDFDATSEVYGGLALSVPSSPAIRVYYDFDEIEGAYIQLSLGHTIKKVTQWGDDCYCDVQAGATVAYGTSGYNDGYFGVDEGGMNDLALSLSLPITLGTWTIRPVVAYSAMIDEDLRAATASSDNFWGGIGASVSF